MHIISWIKQWKLISKKELNNIRNNSEYRLELYLEEKKKLELVEKKLLEYKTGTDKLKKTVEEYKLEKYWENKYPKATIMYKCRSFPFSKEAISIPINNLVTPNCPIIRDDLIKWGLYKTGEDHETLIPKIHKKVYEKFYSYKHDEEVWGESEVWEFPFEMHAKGFSEGFDCDSWATFHASYYIAAGIPSWKIRCVAGDTSIVIGGKIMAHLTTYAYSEHTGKFHHLNSTYGQLWSVLNEYPTHKDAEEGRDDVGIKKVWFSFTDKSAFHDFKSEINMKNIVIKNVNE